MNCLHRNSIDCRKCGDSFCQDCGGYGFNNEENEFCSESCAQDWQERMAERQMEAYYGSSSCQTDQERYQAAAIEKRKLG